MNVKLKVAPSDKNERQGGLPGINDLIESGFCFCFNNLPVLRVKSGELLVLAQLHL